MSAIERFETRGKAGRLAGVRLPPSPQNRAVQLDGQNGGDHLLIVAGGDDFRLIIVVQIAGHQPLAAIRGVRLQSLPRQKNGAVHFPRHTIEGLRRPSE